MDDLDLYDDLDEFQEQQERKSKELQDVEDKYQQSLETIQGLEDENKALKKKIQRMELSFQSLLDTARTEIKRKDREIERLRKEKDDICFRRKFPHRSQESESRPFQQVIRNPFAAATDTATSESQTNDIVYSSVENESKVCDRTRENPFPDRSKDSQKRHNSREAPNAAAIENDSTDRGRSREKQYSDRSKDSQKRHNSREAPNAAAIENDSTDRGRPREKQYSDRSKDSQKRHNSREAPNAAAIENDSTDHGRPREKQYSDRSNDSQKRHNSREAPNAAAIENDSTDRGRPREKQYSDRSKDSQKRHRSRDSHQQNYNKRPRSEEDHEHGKRREHKRERRKDQQEHHDKRDDCNQSRSRYDRERYDDLKNRDRKTTKSSESPERCEYRRKRVERDDRSEPRQRNDRRSSETKDGNRHRDNGKKLSPIADGREHNIHSTLETCNNVGKQSVPSNGTQYTSDVENKTTNKDESIPYPTKLKENKVKETDNSQEKSSDETDIKGNNSSHQTVDKNCQGTEELRYGNLGGLVKNKKPYRDDTIKKPIEKNMQSIADTKCHDIEVLLYENLNVSLDNSGQQEQELKSTENTTKNKAKLNVNQTDTAENGQDIDTLLYENLDCNDDVLPKRTLPSNKGTDRSQESTHKALGTPRKAALFDALFGPSPSNGNSSDSNTSKNLLNNIMGILSKTKADENSTTTTAGEKKCNQVTHQQGFNEHEFDKCFTENEHKPQANGTTIDLTEDVWGNEVECARTESVHHTVKDKENNKETESDTAEGVKGAMNKADAEIDDAVKTTEDLANNPRTFITSDCLSTIHIPGLDLIPSDTQDTILREDSLLLSPTTEGEERHLFCSGQQAEHLGNKLNDQTATKLATKSPMILEKSLVDNLHMAGVNIPRMDLISPESIVLPVPEESLAILFETPKVCGPTETTKPLVGESLGAPTSLEPHPLSSLTKVSSSITETENCATQNHAEHILITPHSARIIPCLDLISPEALSALKEHEVSLASKDPSTNMAGKGIDCFSGPEIKSNSSVQNCAENKTGKSGVSLSPTSNVGFQETESNTVSMLSSLEAQKVLDQNPADNSVSTNFTTDCAPLTSRNYVLTSPERLAAIPCLDLTSPKVSSAIKRRSMSTTLNMCTKSKEVEDTPNTTVAISDLDLITYGIKDNFPAQKRIINMAEDLNTLEKSQDSGLELISAEDRITPAADLKTASIAFCKTADPFHRRSPETCYSLKSLDSVASTDTSEISTNDQINPLSIAAFEDLDIITSQSTSLVQSSHASIIEELNSNQIEKLNYSALSSKTETNGITAVKISQDNVIALDDEDNSRRLEKSYDTTAEKISNNSYDSTADNVLKSHESSQENVSEPEVIEIADDDEFKSPNKRENVKEGNGSVEGPETKGGLPPAKNEGSQETCTISSDQIKFREEEDEEKSNQIEKSNHSSLSGTMIANAISAGKFSDVRVIALDDDESNSSTIERTSDSTAGTEIKSNVDSQAVEISEPEVIEIADEDAAESQRKRTNENEIILKRASKEGSLEKVSNVEFIEETDGKETESQSNKKYVKDINGSSKEVYHRNISDSELIEIADDEEAETERTRRNVIEIIGSSKEAIQRNISDSEFIEIADDDEADTERNKKNVNEINASSKEATKRNISFLELIEIADDEEAETERNKKNLNEINGSSKEVTLRNITALEIVEIPDDKQYKIKSHNNNMIEIKEIFEEPERITDKISQIGKDKAEISLETGKAQNVTLNTESNACPEELKRKEIESKTSLSSYKSDQSAQKPNRESKKLCDEQQTDDRNTNETTAFGKMNLNDTNAIHQTNEAKEERQNTLEEETNPDASVNQDKTKAKGSSQGTDSEISKSLEPRKTHEICENSSGSQQEREVERETACIESFADKPSKGQLMGNNEKAVLEVDSSLNSKKTTEPEIINVNENRSVQPPAAKCCDLHKDASKEKRKQDEGAGNTSSECLGNSKTNVIAQNVNDSPNEDEGLKTNPTNIESCGGIFSLSNAGEDGKDLLTILSNDMICSKEPQSDNQTLGENNSLACQKQLVTKEIINGPENLRQIEKSSVQINYIVKSNSEVTDKDKKLSPKGFDAKQNQSPNCLTAPKEIIHKHLGNNRETEGEKVSSKTSAIISSATSKLELVNISHTAIKEGRIQHVHGPQELSPAELDKQDLQILCQEIIKPSGAIEHLLNKENVAQSIILSNAIATTSLIKPLAPNVKLNETRANAPQSMEHILDNPELPKSLLISPLKAKEWIQRRIIINPNVDSSNSLKSSTLTGGHSGLKEPNQRRLLNNTAADSSNTLKTSTIPDSYSAPNILPSISTNCPTPSNFSGIFSKKPLDTVEDALNIKKKSPKSKACILPAASVLCTRDNLVNATKSPMPTINKKLHWELLKNKNAVSDIEDDSDAEISNDGQKLSEVVEKLAETEQVTLATTMPQTPSKTLRCLETLNKTASESEETKSLKLSNLNVTAMTKNPVNARRRNTIDTVPITHAVSYYKQLEELENFKDLTINGCKGIKRPSAASETGTTIPSKVLKYRPQKMRMSKKLRAKLMASSPIRVRSAESLMDASLYKATMTKRKQICVCLHSKSQRFRPTVKSKKINAKHVAKTKAQLCRKSTMQITEDKKDEDMIPRSERILEDDGRPKHSPMAEKKIGEIISTNTSEQLVDKELGRMSTSSSGNSPACIPNVGKVKKSTKEDISHKLAINQCTPAKASGTQETWRGPAQKEVGRDRELEDIVQFKTPPKKDTDTNLSVSELPQLSTRDDSDVDKNTNFELDESPAKVGDMLNTSTIYPKEHSSSDEQNSSVAENSEPECNKYLKKDDDIQTKITESPQDQINSTAKPKLQSCNGKEGLANATAPVATAETLKPPDKSFIVNYKIPKLKKANQENVSSSKVESLDDTAHKVRPLKGHLSSYGIPKVNTKSNDNTKAKSWIIETYNAKRNITDEAGDSERRQKSEEKKERPEKKEAIARKKSIVVITQDETLAAAYSQPAEAVSQENARKETSKARRKSINISRSEEYINQVAKLDDQTAKNINNNSPQLSNSSLKARRKSLNIHRRIHDSSTDEECRNGSRLEDKTTTTTLASSQDKNYASDLKSSGLKTRRKSVNIQRRTVGLSSSDDDKQMPVKTSQECTITAGQTESLKSTNKESKHQNATAAAKKHISTPVVNNQTPNNSNFADDDDVYRQFLKARSEYLRLQRQIFDNQSHDKTDNQCNNIEEQPSHSLDSEKPATQTYSTEPDNNRILKQEKLPEKPKQSKDSQENYSKSIKRRRQSVHSLAEPKNEAGKCRPGKTGSDQDKDEISLKIYRKSIHSDDKSMGKRRKSVQVDRKTLKSSGPDPIEQNMNEGKYNPTTEQQVEPVKQLRTRRKSLYVEWNSLNMEENDKSLKTSTTTKSLAKANVVHGEFEETHKCSTLTKPAKRREKDKDAPLETKKTANKVNNSNEGSSSNGTKDTNTTGNLPENKLLIQDLSKHEKALTGGEQTSSTSMIKEQIKPTAVCKSTKPLRTRSKSIYVENPNSHTDPNEESIILTPQMDVAETKAIHYPLPQLIPNNDTGGQQSDSDASSIIRNRNINKMRRKSLNIQRRILDSSDDDGDADGTPHIPPKTVIQNVDIVAPPPASTKRSPRKRRTVKILSTSHDDIIIPNNAMKTKSDGEDVKNMSSSSPTFNHPIFHTQVRDEPQPNINSLTPLSQDDRFNEIDSNMQDMFRSPQREPDVSIQAPPVQDTITTTMIAAEHLHDSNANVTIDETVCSSTRQNEHSSLDISALPLLDSTLAHNQSEAKHLSLGSTEYRFEKVSENVVNLFISRKRKRKRTN